MINCLELLKKEKIENEQAKEYIEILDSKSQRLKKLTEDLVEASKVSTGNISLKLEKINVGRGPSDSAPGTMTHLLVKKLKPYLK